jgi:hypothetical protein
MAAAWTVIFVVAALVIGYVLFDENDWKKW